MPGYLSQFGSIEDAIDHLMALRWIPVIATTPTTSSASVAWVDVEGLSFRAEAGQWYVVFGDIVLDTSDGSGLAMSFTDPSGCETEFWWTAPTSTTAMAHRISLADDTGSVITPISSTGSKVLCHFRAFVNNSSTAGTWQLRISGEAGTAITIYAPDSSMHYRRTL